jgi:cation diffusion facilitator family transporter
MALKFYAFYITRSAAIFSDALESIINVVASAFAIASVVIASRPPDKNHPYGHGKIEFFSAGFEGGLIVVAAGGIFYSGVSQLIDPRVLPNLNTGLVLLVGVGVLNLLLGLHLVRVGRRTDSLTLIADGKHVLSDVYTTAGVLAGLLLVRISGWLWLDGLVACLVGIHILIVGAGLLRQSYRELMHTADPVALTALAELLIENRRDLWIDIHQLRTWKSGNHTHVDMHLVLPRDLDLEAAHGEAKKMETLIIDHFKGNASPLIHIDPCIQTDCPVCSMAACQKRTSDIKLAAPWTLETLTAYKGVGSFLGKKRR